jgi:hypothetical protein
MLYRDVCETVDDEDDEEEDAAAAKEKEPEDWHDRKRTSRRASVQMTKRKSFAYVEYPVY